MAYNTRDYWVFGLRPLSGILKNTTFRKLICFHPQVTDGRHLLCWVRYKELGQ
jgi:hypothetical protein